MEQIKQIKLPNGSTYEVVDATAREQIDQKADKNEATTIVTDDGEGNVVLTNVAIDEDKPTYDWNEISNKPFTDGKLNPDCLPDDIGGGSENAVEYIEQTLTEEQKAQARTNIGAAPAYTYGITDLTAGTSALETGKLYFVYE